MAYYTRFLIYAGFILFLITGCSGKGNPSAPDTLDDSTEPLELTDVREVSDYNGSHFPLFHNLVYMNVTDPENVEYEIVPLREGFFHLNILKFLEVSPCTDCFEIVGVEYPEPGIINVDFKITHPYDDPLYTIFDVRGIMMFYGSHLFPESGLTLPDKLFGSGELLNPDGFTSLYNKWSKDVDAPDFRKYFKGNFASNWTPNALVNGYIRHISDDPSNTRNALLTGDSVTRTYSMKYPANEFFFGYAVDASWAPPLETPVDDPMEDFGPDANSPEPWKIEVYEEPIGEGLTHEGGVTNLVVNVFDWQGSSSYETPIVECPELFDGVKIATLIAEDVIASTWLVSIDNAKLAPGGYYKCLVSVQDNDYNPNFPWIDMKAYQVVEVRVQGLPIAIADLDPNLQDIGVPIYFWSYNSYDPDGDEIVLHEWDWNNDGIYDETGPEVWHAFDTIGTHKVQCRVTDENGLSGDLDLPLIALIPGEGYPISPIDVTPGWLTSYPMAVWMVDNFAYITMNPASLLIVDLVNPAEPALVGVVELPLLGEYLTVADGYAFVMRSYVSKLCIVDIDPPGQAYVVNELYAPGFPADLEARDGYLFIGAHKYLQIWDVDPPETAGMVSQIEMTVDTYWWHDPFNPFTPPEKITTYGTASSVELSGDFLYIADTTGDTGILHKINIESPENPVPIFQLGEEFDSICVVGNHLYSNDFPDWGTTVLDIRNLNDLPDDEIIASVDIPFEVELNGLWQGPDGIIGARYGNDGWSLIDVDPPDQAYIINQFDSYAGRTAYSNGVATLVSEPGVELWDIDPPEAAKLVRELKTIGEAVNITVGGGYAYLAATGEQPGVRIIDIDPLESSIVIGNIELDIFIRSLFLEDNYLFINWSEHYSGAPPTLFDIYDVSTPGDANLIDSVEFKSHTINCVSDGYAYFFQEDQWFYIYDVDPVDSVEFVKHLYVYSSGNSGILHVDDGYAYLAGWSFPGIANLTIIDVDPPETAHAVCDVPGTAIPGSIDTNGGYAYMVAGHMVIPGCRLYIYDIDPVENTSLVNTIQLPDGGRDIVISNGYAFIPGTNSLCIVDISAGEDAFVVNTVPVTGHPNNIVVEGSRIYMSTDDGIRIFDLW